MVRYSNDVNVYIESKSPITEKTIPVVQKAAGVYRRAAKNLENPEAREITQTTLSDEYYEASRLFEDSAVRIYGILGAKSGVTQEEWDFIVSSIAKGTFIFPDISLALGTTIKWQIKDDEADAFIREILRKHGTNVRIITNDGGSLLFDNDAAFTKQMAADLGVNTGFEMIEKKLETADYSGTKKRLHYLTIYDFVKYQLGIEGTPSKEELITALEKCKCAGSANIIEAKELIKKTEGDFWGEYEKYREFKMFQVLARWYGKSYVRYLNRDSYEYFSDKVSEELLNNAVKYLKVHTASLNLRSCKAETKGTSASFTFRIQGAAGDIVATVCENNYADSYQTAENKITLADDSSLTITGLTFGVNYCVSLWEDMGNGDVVKLGDLPKVTPGISWPAVDKFEKSPFSDTIKFSVKLSGGDGNLSFTACMKKGKGEITSPSDGVIIQPAVDSNTLRFDVKGLEFEQEYVFCVFALIDGGKFINKLVDDFTYTPHEASFERIIRITSKSKAISLDKEVYLDFESRQWPESFGNSTVTFACRTDRFPENPQDGQSGFTMTTLNEKSYADSVFKVIAPKDEVYNMLYICGWLRTLAGDTQLVIHSIIYDLCYKFKSNTFSFLIDNVKNQEGFRLPNLRITCFDKKDAVVFSDNNIKADENGTFTVNPTGKVKYVVVETANPALRQVYQFRNAKGFAIGKSQVSIF